MKSIQVKKESKSLVKKLSEIIKTVFTIAFLALGTLIVILYSKGYRFNLHDTVVEKTGVISMESQPNRANLYIDGEYLGKTPKSVGSIKEGDRKVKLELEGYNNWEKTLPVIIEKSSPYFAYLFLKKPIETTIEGINITTNNYSLHSSRDAIFIASIEQNDSKQKLFKIYKYTIMKPFWDMYENPVIIYSEVVEGYNKIDIMPSNDSSYFLISKLQDAQIEGEKISFTNSIDNIIAKSTILIKTLDRVTSPSDINLNGFSNSGYKMLWSNDNNHLILLSNKEIYSYNIDSKVVALLKKGEEEINTAFFTSQSGLFYSIEQDTSTSLEKESTNTDIVEESYFIKRKNLDGSNSEPILEIKICDLNTPILENTTNDESFEEEFCLNEEIKEFYIPENNLGIALFTDSKFYWYEEENEIFTKVDELLKKDLEESNKSFNFLSFSPDQKNLLYEIIDIDINNKLNSLKQNNVFVYTFEKNETDHVTKIGKRAIYLSNENEETSCNNIKWAESSSHFVSSCDEKQVKIIDIDSENNYSLAESSTGFSLLSNDLKWLFTVDASPLVDSTLEVEPSVDNTFQDANMQKLSISQYQLR